jgi:secreted PhoX family phosphatase
MAVSRRQLLAGGAAGVGLAVAGTVPSLGTPAGAATPNHDHHGGGRPFPPLVDDPDGILALPDGFHYRIVARAGDTDLDDGVGKTPSHQDGTGSFPLRGGGVRLIQNHELTPYMSQYGVPWVEGTVYDRGAPFGGGCTVVEVDKRGRRVAEWVGISGTATNCAGGPTPWGSWMTCEETEAKAGSTWSAGGQSGAYEKNHGYVFEVFTDSSRHQNPLPIKAFGRFAHEALVVEPSRKRVYLTEDASNPNGLFYRWTAPHGVTLGPGVGAKLSPTAGKLEAMKVLLDDGSVLPDLAYITSAQLGRPFRVEWTEVPDRDATTTSTRKQLTAGVDVTPSKKLEGVWGDQHGAYVVASFAFAPADLPADATKHDGQVWYYNYAEQTIKLVTYFPHLTATDTADHAVKYPDLYFDGPDNVHVTPWGSLVLAEDGVGASHVLSSTPGGATYAIARNQLLFEGSYSEFTGPNFAPDGSVLFVNIQTPGITLAISGPWGRYLG